MSFWCLQFPPKNKQKTSQFIFWKKCLLEKLILIFFLSILLKHCIDLGDTVQNSGVREEPVQQLAGDSGDGVGAAYTTAAPGDALVGQHSRFGWVCVCVEIESGAACPRMRSWSSSWTGSMEPRPQPRPNLTLHFNTDRQTFVHERCPDSALATVGFWSFNL